MNYTRTINLFHYLRCRWAQSCWIPLHRQLLVQFEGCDGREMGQSAEMLESLQTGADCEAIPNSPCFCFYVLIYLSLPHSIDNLFINWYLITYLTFFLSFKKKWSVKDRMMQKAKQDVTCSTGGWCSLVTLFPHSVKFLCAQEKPNKRQELKEKRIKNESETEDGNKQLKREPEVLKVY